ncbi:hypothetical protein E2C01_087281 [Portunus trituberculatus]|uniref:Uncharacterized protein n=1 Tax=Portunus trituberculatus TaxID=210409 RepID=A0A5B7JC19_PORTR|nr:hypothetical protein [Portunus trituberculatus]
MAPHFHLRRPLDLTVRLRWSLRAEKTDRGTFFSGLFATKEHRRVQRTNVFPSMWPGSNSLPPVSQ